MARESKRAGTPKARQTTEPVERTASEPLRVVVYEPVAPARSGVRPRAGQGRPDQDDIVRGGDGDDPPRSGWDVFGWVRKVEDVPAQRLQSSLQSFLSTMGATLALVPNEIGAYRLDEIAIEIEVSAEGEVGLLGTGGKLGGKGSLSLKLKRT